MSVLILNSSQSFLQQRLSCKPKLSHYIFIHIILLLRPKIHLELCDQCACMENWSVHVGKGKRRVGRDTILIRFLLHRLALLCHTSRPSRSGCYLHIDQLPMQRGPATDTAALMPLWEKLKSLSYQSSDGVGLMLATVLSTAGVRHDSVGG